MNLDVLEMAANEVAKQQSLADLEELYIWLRQFEDPAIEGGKIL